MCPLDENRMKEVEEADSIRDNEDNLDDDNNDDDDDDDDDDVQTGVSAVLSSFNSDFQKNLNKVQDNMNIVLF